MTLEYLSTLQSLSEDALTIHHDNIGMTNIG